MDIEDDDAVIIVEADLISDADVAKKRKTDPIDDVTIKKRKIDVNNGHSEKEICIVDSGDSDDEPQHVITIQKVIPKKHKPSSDDECSIVYDDTANNLVSSKKAKTSN